MNQPAISPGRRQARLMRVVNVPMRRLLRLPLQTPLSRQLMLLTFTGRKTGRVYRQPVSYVPDGDTLLTRPEVIRDVDQVERLLRRMMASNPRTASFIPWIGRDGQIDRGKLQTAVDHGFAIIRWRIDQTPPSGRS